MLTRLLHKLLYYNGIKIDSLLISSIFKGHPIQHSMRAISDTLDSLGVSNIVCRLNFEELMEIKKPCLVVLGDDEYPFYILKNFDATKKEIRVVSVYNKSFTIKTHIFTSLWNNTVLCIADNEDEVESFSFLYYVRQLLWNMDYYAWPCIIIILLLMSILYGFYADIAILQILLKNIGIVISAIIVSGTDKIKYVCRRNKGNRCSIIFKERFRVFQWISLGELSLAYFISSLLALLLFPESLMFVFIGMFNMLVVLFSVVYQILHKNFCLFCMSLNIILVIEFFYEILRYNINFSLAYLNNIVADSIVFIIFMITSVLMIRKISCLYFDKNKYSHIKAKYEYLLSNQNYLWYVLDKSSPVCSDEDDMEFVSNEVKSDIVITIVINPLCDKCFGIIERVWMLNTYKINIVFVANYNNEKSINVSKTMISYSKNHNWNDTYIMLENWYKKKVLPEVLITEDTELIYSAFLEFSKKVQIQYTPFVLVNNKKLPEIYDIEDLMVLL